MARDMHCENRSPLMKDIETGETFIKHYGQVAKLVDAIVSETISLIYLEANI